MPRFRLPSVYREAWELSEVRSSQRCRFTHTHIHTRTHTHKHTRSLVRTHMFCWRPSRVRPYPPTALLAFHVPCVRPVTTNPRAALRALCSRPAPQTAWLDTCLAFHVPCVRPVTTNPRAALRVLCSRPAPRTARLDTACVQWCTGQASRMVHRAGAQGRRRRDSVAVERHHRQLHPTVLQSAELFVS